MTAVVYVRQSLDRTGDGAAVARQEQDARELAARRGWPVVEVIRDNDVSAAGRVRRPGFERLVAMVEARQVSTVIAWDLTRLTRNARDTLRLVEAGQAAGVTVALVRGSDIDLATPAGRLTADVLAAVAHHEIAQKSDRQKRAARQAAEQGRPGGGPRAFGYEQDGVTIRQSEADALRSAYDALLAGVSLGAVARSLNDAGLDTPRGGPWRTSTIRRTLLNPRYAGLRAVHRRDEHSPDQWQVIGPAQWTGIVPEETWRAVVDVLTDPTRARPTERAVGLLSSIGRCGVEGCDSTVHRGGTAARLGYATYRCRQTPAHLSRRCDPTDRYVIDVVIERLSRPDAADLLVDHDRADAPALRSRAQTLRQARRSLVRLVDGQTFTEDEIRTRAAEIDQQLTEIEAQLSDAGRADVLRPLIEAADVRKAVEDLTTDRLRAVIDTMMTVTLLPVGRGTRTFRPESVVIERKERHQT